MPQDLHFLFSVSGFNNHIYIMAYSLEEALENFKEDYPESADSIEEVIRCTEPEKMYHIEIEELI